MGGRCLTVTEHEPLAITEDPSPTTLSVEEAERVARIGELRPGFCRRGYRSVQFAQYCGIVGLGARALEILPKVDRDDDSGQCRDVLLRLLKHSGRSRAFQHLPVGQSLRKANLLDIFIAAFLDALGRLVRSGLMRRYHEQEEDLTCVRGQIAAARQFALLANRGDVVACRFDELTIDNVWNRAVKYALRLVQPRIASTDVHRRWTELWAVFVDVSDLPVGVEVLDRLTIDRQAGRYEEVMQWVRWIVGDLSPTLRAGDNSAPALLFDMNVLFESSVAWAMRRDLVMRGFDVHEQVRGYHLAHVQGSAHREIPLCPDVVIKRGGMIAAIADTKWKLVGIDANGYLCPEATDVYQMHAYASATGCERLALIYPRHSDLASSRETVYELPAVGTRRPLLRIELVDVHADPFDVSGAVRGILATPEGLAEPAFSA